MSTTVPFTPSTTSVFTFQPVLGQTQYNASVTWNSFGQRFYLNLTDLSNNPLLTASVVGSGVGLVAMFSWGLGTAIVSTQLPHNVPVGTLTNLTAAGTGSVFDGDWQMLATGLSTLTYPLMPNPQEPVPLNGTVEYRVNLVAALGIGTLLYHADSQTFEYA